MSDASGGHDTDRFAGVVRPLQYRVDFGRECRLAVYSSAVYADRSDSRLNTSHFLMRTYITAFFRLNYYLYQALTVSRSSSGTIWRLSVDVICLNIVTRVIEFMTLKKLLFFSNNNKLKMISI